MKLPLKPHLLVLLCSVGLFAASGVMFVKSRATEPAAPAPAPIAAPAPADQTAPVVAPTYSAAQIDQWVAPIALYPDSLLSQILMASTYPANVIQAAQWSKDNPKMQGDAAIQAVASQPWDPSVKSLVAFPQLMSLMGENPPWVQSLGDAFLAQPKDVMDSVQRLRALAQQTGALQSTPQQTVTTSVKNVPPPRTQTQEGVTVQSTAPPAPTVIKIESADPQVVYVPTYNPNTVYGTWPNTAYPPTYLPPTPGEQFGNSFVNGLGFSLGVATTYAIFSNIDWDDDDDHHHNDDWDNHGGYNRNGDNNININVDNFNKISGQRLTDANRTWQHNPAYREGVPYPNNQLNNRFHSTNTATGLSSTQQRPVNRDSQRQAAMSQMEKSTGKTFPQTARTGTKDAQRQASSQQLKQISQRNNYRGYDTKPQTAKRTSTQQRENRQAVAQRQEKRVTQPAQQRNLQQRTSQPRANALSGNDSRSANWQAQQQRGAQSRQVARNQPSRQPSGGRAEHREFRHR
ncbi:DUF3300 domain-containing protein [Citrobacter freundii]|uniref:DUF3300 domain-containing protein n=1 Tax=Citrobacter freundii TaxID=546 RepID=A0ABY7L122_CITFR|nr:MULTISPECIES: DUF3300 domain-containing protein [Citrobacter]EIJ9081762.1 DUF3300 domain-containing protein [Citrobacter freundii]EJH9547799.1 DUF3300 domain-containing protein [Citrobacter freundii]EJO6483055.1 DUF3300 domain-containing protein [Citrobacter freundii]EKW5686155.1 DUF3300 domain-containing protein [Citrobacter freundii]EKX5705828.1 DUF3300 domain-containing protein [Citrobacter freundii]